MKVEFYVHHLSDQDIENAVKTLRSLFLTTGPVTETFEKKLSDYTGLRHILAVNSCTAALHLALLGLGIGPGDEVITTPMTFIATATAIMHTGATPVFVDVEEKTGLMNAGLVEGAITPRTKAIIPVHLYGSMVDMKAIKDIADRHHLKIIEDCAHCIEGVRDNIRPGQLSDAACYSFYATKNLTCGEGGALGTNNPELADSVRILRLHGMSKDAISRYQGPYRHWDMVALGWKYNLDDIHSALLVNQIDSIDERWEQRKEKWQLYDELLKPFPHIEIPETRGKNAMHLYTVWVDPDKRDLTLHDLHHAGIGVAVNYCAVHTLTFFKKRFGYHPDDFPLATKIGLKTISIPFYTKLNKNDIIYVVENIKNILRSNR